MNLEKLIAKLALGTVQLGLSYGINNRTGKPNQDEVNHILDTAQKHKINILDSAESYGDSLRVIGTYINNNPSAKFDVISKFIEDGDLIVNKLNSTLEILNKDCLYAYMYHRFDDYQKGENKTKLLGLKENGKIRKIGVSIYSVDELELIVKDPFVDLVQLPYNIFDASEEKTGLMEDAKLKGKEIHVRSIFLQGLFFKKTEELTGKLMGLSDAHAKFKKIINHHDLTTLQACLNHAIHSPLIDKVIIGVEKSTQLNQNIQALLTNYPDGLNEKLKTIEVLDKTLLNPAKWNLS